MKNKKLIYVLGSLTTIPTFAFVATSCQKKPANATEAVEASWAQLKSTIEGSSKLPSEIKNRDIEIMYLYDVTYGVKAEIVELEPDDAKGELKVSVKYSKDYKEIKTKDFVFRNLKKK